MISGLLILLFFLALFLLSIWHIRREEKQMEERRAAFNRELASFYANLRSELEQAVKGGRE